MDKLAAMATFAAVVEAGSFTGAAELLALPRSRVSQRVSDLEKTLGVRLLNRTTRALNLTDDGRAYYLKCQSILLDIEEMENTLQGGALQPRGRLRVEALVSIARWVIAPRLHEFQAQYPHITVRLGGSDRIRNLLEEGIDCAVRGGHLEDSSQIARHICDVRVGLYAAPAYLQSQARPSHPRDLEEHRRLSWFAGQRHPFAWKLISDTQTEAFDVPETEAPWFDDPDVAMAACLAGGGICPGAPFAVESLVRTGALVPVLPEWSFEPRPIHIVYPSNKHLSARVRGFVDWSVSLMRSNPSLRMGPLELFRSCESPDLAETSCPFQTEPGAA